MAEIGNPQRENAIPSTSTLREEYSISADMILTINHGMPKKPEHVWLRLKNIVAELGYAVGDEVEMTTTSEVTVAVNSTQIKVVFTGRPTVVDFGTNTGTFITAADWNLIIKAEVT